MNSNKPIPDHTFCILPWIHLNVWPSGDVHACCLGDWSNPIGNVKNNTLEEIANSDALKLMRKQMLDGVTPSVCERCVEREHLNITSLRQSKNNIFKHLIPEALANTTDDYGLKKLKLRYWDFRFSNLCNMKCRMCGAGFSSMWYDDEIAIGGKTHINKRVVNANDYSKQDLITFIDDNINDVEFIYFAGGEPLIMDEHYYILEKLIEIGKTDTVLRYNTNGLKLQFKSHNLLELWSKFSKVNVACSIDSYGKRAEYVRHGTRWDVLTNNISTLVAMDNITLEIEVTTSIFNIYTLPELFDELVMLGVQLPQIQTHNILQNPVYYHSALLSDSDKQNVVDKFTSYKNQHELQESTVLQSKFSSVIENMYKNLEDKQMWLKMFKDKTDTLDKLRHENFLKTFPELANFYNSINND